MENTEPGPQALLPPGLRERFQVLGVLGRGGMGLVLRARDQRMGREVALKFMQGDQTAATRERFVREGQLASSLTHEAVVQVHSAGEVEGSLFLVQELVPGARTLRDLEDPAAALRLLIQAGRGLGAAHALGIVHRDVKPENLLVSAEGALKVSDFGVALGVELERMTVSGALVGTPSYMAPEQIGGVRAEVCPATDVWGLGVILYEVVTGGLPFEAANLVELIGMIQRGAPPLPAGPPLATRAIREVCDRALASRPQDRFPDGAAFADALEAALAGRKPVGSRRSRLPLVLVLLGLGALSAAAVWGTQAPASPPPPSPSQTRPTPVSSADRDLAAAQGAGKRRLEALWRWCVDHPEDPRRATVRAEIAELAREVPVLRFQIAPEGVPRLLFREGQLYTWKAGSAQRWEWPGLVAHDLGFRASFMAPAEEGWLVFDPDTRRLRRFRRGKLEEGRLRSAFGVVFLGGEEALLYTTRMVRRVDLARGKPRPFFKSNLQLRNATYDPKLRQFVVALGDVRAQGVPENGRVHSWIIGEGIIGEEGSHLSLTTSGAASRVWLGEGELMVGTSLGVIRAFDRRTLAPRGIYEDTTEGELIPVAHDDGITDLVISPEGGRLASASPGRDAQGGERGGKVKVWDQATRARLRVWSFAEVPASLAFSPDGEVLLIGLRGGRVEGYLVP